jgi:hypothetical protein
MPWIGTRLQPGRGVGSAEMLDLGKDRRERSRNLAFGNCLSFRHDRERLNQYFRYLL